jgi:hypothetical protein
MTIPIPGRIEFLARRQFELSNRRKERDRLVLVRNRFTNSDTECYDITQYDPGMTMTMTMIGISRRQFELSNRRKQGLLQTGRVEKMTTKCDTERYDIYSMTMTIRMRGILFLGENNLLEVEQSKESLTAAELGSRNRG